ncbi:MAG: hypothetical protein SFY96_06570 [Planctomycetota bacterium]|nr:hypothetical protein [Planctomycetota bacterium]
MGFTAWMFSGFAIAFYGGFLRRAIDGRRWPVAVGILVILGMTQLGWGIALHEAGCSVLDAGRFGEDRGLYVSLIGTAIIVGGAMSIDRRQWLPVVLSLCAAAVGGAMLALRSQLAPGWSGYLEAWSVLPLHVALAWPLYRDAKRAINSVADGRDCCLSCGYDLRGITDRCPECGAPLPQRTTF